MRSQAGAFKRACEKCLADALTGVAIELRMADVIDLVADIHHERHFHLEDIINSAAELFFKPDTMRFLRIGEVDLTWDRPATVTFSMEFHHMQVRAYFRLQIAADQAGVRLEFLESGTGNKAGSCDVSRLSAALAGAKLDLPPQIFARYQKQILTAEFTS